MFECFLFSFTDKISDLTLLLQSTGWKKSKISQKERNYTSKTNKITHIPEKNSLLCRSIYDFNKNKKTIICSFDEYRILKCENLEEELFSFDFKFKNEVNVEGYLFVKGEVKLEAVQFGENYLLKLFVICESPNEGENMVEREKENFIKDFTFVKPPVDWLNDDFKK